MAVDSASGTDKDKGRKGDAPAPVEGGESTGDTDGARASQTDGPDLGNAEKQRRVPTEGIESGDEPHSQAPATKPPEAPAARIHRPPPAPSHCNMLSSVIADQPTTLVEQSSDCPSVPAIPVSPNSSIATPIMSQRLAPESSSPPNRPAVSISTFGGARDFTLSNPVFNTAAGNLNSTIFKFDGSECSR